MTSTAFTTNTYNNNTVHATADFYDNRWNNLPKTLLRWGVPGVVSRNRHCRGPASRTPGFETSPIPLVCGPIALLALMTPTEVAEAGLLAEAVL